METQMKIRESCLQNGIFNYKQGIPITKQDFYLQIGSLGLQTGFSACYSPKISKMANLNCEFVKYKFEILTS